MEKVVWFHQTTSGATPAAIRKLYHVKEKNICATERPLSWDSFNSGDCFILDLGENIFAWCDRKSNILEHNKARNLELAIRARQDKAQVDIITDGQEPAAMLQVLGPKSAPNEGNPEEDSTADQTNAQATALYKVSDATGQMNLTKVADSSPFASELLIPDDCFALAMGCMAKSTSGRGEKLMRRSGRWPSKWLMASSLNKIFPKHSGGDSAPRLRESHLQAILQKLEVRVGIPIPALLPPTTCLLVSPLVAESALRCLLDAQ